MPHPAALTYFHKKEIPTMKTILTGAILAVLFAVAGCSQTVEQPSPTSTNGAETPGTTGYGGHMGSGNMPGGQENGTGHMDGNRD
jgi:hypothetical protein